LLPPFTANSTNTKSGLYLKICSFTLHDPSSDPVPLTPALIPFNYDLKLQSKSGLVVKNEERYKKNFSLFHSVFDAAAIGQYLGGIDSRNMKFNFFKRILKRKVKFVNESAVYDVSKFSYYWEKDQLGRKIPYLNYRGENVKINNLHIHSKELKDFR
jgi:hypothetical protein